MNARSKGKLENKIKHCSKLSTDHCILQKKQRKGGKGHRNLVCWETHKVPIKTLVR